MDGAPAAWSTSHPLVRRFRSDLISLGIVQAVGWVFLNGAGARMQIMVREEPQPRKKPPVPQELPLHSIPSRSGWRSAIYPPVEWMVRRQRGLKAILWFGVFVPI